VLASVVLVEAEADQSQVLRKAIQERDLVLEERDLVQALSSQYHKSILLVYPLMNHQAYKIFHIGHN
jgi:hypothetical protein